MNTIEKLDRLAEIQAHQTVLGMDYDEKRRSIQATIQSELDALDAEYQPLKNNLSEQSSALEAEIKQETLVTGATIHGAHMMAVWAKGRVSWDSKQLEGMIAIIPQIAAARKEGEPSVSLRKV